MTNENMFRNMMQTSHVQRIWHSAPTPDKLLPWIAFVLYLAALVPTIILYPSMAAVVAAGVVAVFGILWDPFLGILITTCLGMVGELQHFTGSLSLAKVAILLTLLSYLIHSVGRRTLALFDTGIEIPLLTFIAIYILGMLITLGASSGETVAGIVDAVTMLGYPVAFLLVLNIIRTEKQIKYILIALVVGGVLTGTASILQQFSSFNLLSSVRGIEQVTASNGVAGMTRNNGLMLDPNAAAYPQLLALPIVILMVLSARQKSIKLLLSGAALICLIALALTFSRSGYIGFIVSLLPLFIFFRVRRLLKIFTVAAILVLTLTAFVPTSMLIGRFGEIDKERGGESDRSVYFRTAAVELVEHPFIPAGEQDFMTKIEQQVGLRVGPHANIQAVIINAGLPGLVAFLWLAFRYFVFVSRGLRKMPDGRVKYYAVGSLLAMVGFQVQGLFITNLGWFLMWAVLAIPVCCIVCYNSAGRTVYLQRVAIGTGESD
jgi:putative inorganic carbon (HCO3(-)) transporter